MAIVNLSLAVLLFLFSGSVTASCPENEISFCKNELVRLKTSESMILPTTEETLLDLCRMEKDVIDCVDAYASQCLTNSSFKSYLFLTNGTRRIFEAMCSENSEIRDEYLKHAVCLKPIRGDTVYCVESHEKSLGNLNIETLTGDIAKVCCFYFERVKCVSETARKYCGEEAAQLMENLLSEPEDTPFGKMCSMKYSACRERVSTSTYTSDSNSVLFITYSAALYVVIGIILSLKDVM